MTAGHGHPKQPNWCRRNHLKPLASRNIFPLFIAAAALPPPRALLFSRLPLLRRAYDKFPGSSKGRCSWGGGSKDEE